MARSSWQVGHQLLTVKYAILAVNQDMNIISHELDYQGPLELYDEKDELASIWDDCTVR